MVTKLLFMILIVILINAATYVSLERFPARRQNANSSNQLCETYRNHASHCWVTRHEQNSSRFKGSNYCSTKEDLDREWLLRVMGDKVCCPKSICSAELVATQDVSIETSHTFLLNKSRDYHVMKEAWIVIRGQCRTTMHLDCCPMGHPHQDCRKRARKRKLGTTIVDVTSQFNHTYSQLDANMPFEVVIMLNNTSNQNCLPFDLVVYFVSMTNVKEGCCSRSVSQLANCDKCPLW